jgi:hypothetical protein
MKNTLRIKAYHYCIQTGGGDSSTQILSFVALISIQLFVLVTRKAIDRLKNKKPPLFKINLCSNSSKEIVGIKFDNFYTGNFSTGISKTQAQEDISIIDLRSAISALHRGKYGLRLKDVTSHLSCVNQL